MSQFIFLNDKIIEETGGVLSTMDRGFLYGDGIFETLRTYNGVPFLLDDHVVRLLNSAKRLDMPFHLTTNRIRGIIGQLITMNKLQDAYVRMTLSRGTGGNGFIPGGTCNPTFVIHTKFLAECQPSLYKNGVSLVTSNIRRSTSCPVSAHKTLNFLTNYLIKMEAVKQGAYDSLILNTDNHVTECSVSNFFVVEKGNVITPPLSANILPGITRKVVMRLCKLSGIHVSEELFGLARVFMAEECFLTNSLIEIMPVTKIDGKTIGGGLPGNVTAVLHEKYKDLIGKQL